MKNSSVGKELYSNFPNNYKSALMVKKWELKIQMNGQSQFVV